MQTWEEYAKESGLDISEFDLQKELAYIQKVGKQWCVFSEGGKRMGCYSSRPAAERRLKQIEMFKHMKGYIEEAGTYECFCRECIRYFISRKRCDLSRCPFCGADDDSLVEVRGED